MIVSMKRMTLVAHKADETAILNALQGTGAVEVISGGQDSSAQAALERAQSRVHQFGDALKTIRPYAPKKSFFADLIRLHIRWKCFPGTKRVDQRFVFINLGLRRGKLAI